MSRRRRRLDFYVKGLEIPAGHFCGRSYPTKPGRYPFLPYRGMGHAKFAQILREGKVAECCFFRGRDQISLLIVKEEFLPDQPGNHWFVDVSQIGDAIE